MEQQDVAAVDLSITLSTLGGPTPATASEWEFETVKNWAENWLSTAHPDLGRKGPVCPFAGTSIARDLFRVAFVRGHELAHDQMVSLLEEIACAFPTLPPDGTDSIYKVVVIVFPEVTAYDQIDAVQFECKNSFVKSGLMVGQFYPEHQQEGLWNPKFRPLDAPFPMLAVRHMVSTDLMFLRQNSEWMDAYFARFSPGKRLNVPMYYGHSHTKSAR